MSSELVLVTGGAKSGKSVFAEQSLSARAHVCYIATGVMKQPDPEMQLRIKTHQERRAAKNWATEERYSDVAGFITAHHYDSYLLDDATMLITNLFYDHAVKMAAERHLELDDAIEQMTSDDIDQVSQTIFEAWHRIVEALIATGQSMVVVTNETGLGIVPATKQTRILRDIYGQVNQRLAQAADHVYFVVSGLPQQLK
ncbi:bifunctional adenosylcobinamide kinase/adenosylcobinamide-phosphate guanylyltransferase [Secundilactobacillus collinoides]|uniref:Adenosylcobinamide kinase n=1 Tax=Secundilactobacillus collinoides TaxID=33960 RepID=A0A161WCU5_SECCO|nr:bifunctional adenosylcobinamide kinase/adenosylcobinamide-phosphate guanylyltransferase [Secundilactobacillus collinoides]KZL37039.1 adenosylcobinamide kinase [Secundilactobacillus collinoides]